MSLVDSLRRNARRAVQAYDRPAEREFLPAALEVLETPPSPAGRTLMGLIVLFFLIAVAWASLGKVDILATAPGQLRLAGDVKLIQPLDPGRVRVIAVQDGDHVKAGQLLIGLDPTQTSADQDRTAADLRQAELDVARLTAAATGRADAFRAPDGATPEDVARTRAALRAQLDEHAAQLADLGQQISQKHAEGSQVAEESRKLQDSLPLLARKEEIHRELTAKGYGTSLAFLDAQQQLSEARHDIDVDRARGAQAAAAGLALARQRAEADSKFRADVLGDLAKAQERRDELRQELVKATDKSRGGELRAPIDGWVQDLAVHTLGGVVSPAQHLLTVVPEGGRLIAEVRLANRDVGFVRAGQPVKVKIETFSFTRYGLIDGRVMNVSRTTAAAEDARTPARDGAPAAPLPPPGSPTYTARVALDRSVMRVEGQMESLQPGEAVTAEIRTGARTILDYLFSPLARRSQESLHER